MVDIVDNKASRYMRKILKDDLRGINVQGAVENTGPNGEYETIIISCNVTDEIESCLAIPIVYNVLFWKEAIDKEHKVIINEILDIYNTHREDISLGCYDMQGMTSEEINGRLLRYDVSVTHEQFMGPKMLRLYMRFVFEMVRVLDKYAAGMQYIDSAVQYDENEGIYRIFITTRNIKSNEFEVMEIEITYDGMYDRYRFAPDVPTSCLKKIKATLIMKKQLVQKPEYMINLLEVLANSIFTYEWTDFTPYFGVDIVPHLSADISLMDGGTRRIITKDKIQEQLNKAIPYLPSGHTLPTIKDYRTIYLRRDVCMVILNIPMRNNEGYLSFELLLPFEDESLKELDHNTSSVYSYGENTMAEFVAALITALTEISKISWSVIRDAFGLSPYQIPPHENGMMNISALYVICSNMISSKYSLIHKILQSNANKAEIINKFKDTGLYIMYNVSTDKPYGIQMTYGVDDDLNLYYDEIDIAKSLELGELVSNNYICTINEWIISQTTGLRNLINMFVNKTDTDFVDSIDELFYQEWVKE